MFAIETKFSLLETIPVQDPWGMGMVFDVRPITHPEFKAWWKDAFGGSDEEKRLREYRRFLSEKQASEVILRAIDDGLPETEPMRLAEGVALLVAGWHGVLDHDGAEVPFSGDACRQLFAVDMPIDADIQLPDGSTISAGNPIGDALSSWISHYAKDLARYRDDYMEESEKN